MTKFIALLFVMLVIPMVPSASVAFAHPAGASESSPGARSAPFDLQYLDTMAQHHREGIDMFQLAAEKAQSAEIREMAERMIRDQTREIPELGALREQIGSNLPQAVNMNLSGMTAMDMRKLEAASGIEFDRMFLAMTIMHHKGALEMSRAAVKQARHQDIREKAKKIIDKQAGEIAEMEAIRQQL